MNEDEKNLLEDYRQMTAENKACILLMVHSTKVAQENTRRAMKIGVSVAQKNEEKTA